MGVRIFGSSCSCSTEETQVTRIVEKVIEVLPNPDPKNFEVINTLEDGDFLLVKIKYPDCTNYEGMKILLYFGVPLEKFRRLKKIDPHFCLECISPVARFEPTNNGWDLALRLIGTFREK